MVLRRVNAHRLPSPSLCAPAAVVLTMWLQVPLLAPIDEPDADPRAAAKKTSMLVL